MRIRLRMTLGNAHQWRLQKLDALGADETLDFLGPMMAYVERGENQSRP